MNPADLRKFCVDMVLRHHAYDNVADVIRDARELEDYIENGGLCKVLSKEKAA